MGRKSITVFLTAMLLLALMVSADSRYEYAPDRDSNIYFGHISWVEIEIDGPDPVVVRETGVSSEIATLNFPIGPGDIIRTSARRCEIQFDTGTLLRLDTDTELRIETILAQILTHRGRGVTNLVLNRGRVYVMYKRYNRREVFQVKTESAAFKPGHNAVAVLAYQVNSGAKAQVMEGAVNVMFGPDWDRVETRKIKRNQSASVTTDHVFSYDSGRLNADFEGWNLAMNESFPDMHEGMSMLPKPIRRLPKAVQYFAEKYSNMYGEWVWDVMYGYVWRPFVNSDYPSGGWAPYHHGYWRELNGEMYWVPAEPWGWAPAHLGIWTWDTDKGWLWIPGNAFAPSWACWRTFSGRGIFAWRPFYLWDWAMSPSWGDWELGGTYGYSPYSANLHADPEAGGTARKVRKDQLQRPPYRLPSKMKKAYKNVVKALKSGNPHLLRRFANRPSAGFLVRSRDISSRDISGRRVAPSDLLESPDRSRFQVDDDPGMAAVAIYRKNRMQDHVNNLMISNPGSGANPAQQMTIPSLKERVFPDKPSSFAKEGKSRRSKAEPSALKMQRSGHPLSPPPRDWNPDTRSAQRIGATIRYNSSRNEVECPELGLRSRVPGHVGRSGGFSSGGSGGSSGAGGVSSGGSSSGSGSGSRGSGSRASGRSGGGRSGKGSGN